MATAALSVVVCTRDRAAWLDRCLTAIERALEGVDGELIVVDNGSTDHTARVVAAHPAARGLVEPERGLSRARNAGLAAAEGRWIAFTDDDCVPDEDWAARLLDAAAGADGIGGRVLPDAPERVPWWMRRLRGPLVRHDLGPLTRPYLPGDPKFIGANFALSRDTADRFGGFRTDLGHGTGLLGEDSEYCRRLRRGGARLVYAGEAVVRHRVDPERLTVRYAAAWYGKKARELGARARARLTGSGARARAFEP